MKISKEELVADLEKVYQTIGKPPAKKEYIKYGKYGANTVVRKWGTWNNAMVEVIGKVNQNRNLAPLLPIHCPSCLQEFTPNQKEQVFCSRSCSNKAKPRRQLTKKCRACNKLIGSKVTFCKECKNKGRHLRGGQWLSEKSLAEALYKNGANKYGIIRCHARTVTKKREQICEACGYSKHVEVCHKRPIPSFSLETKVKEINSPENLILLCSNCHWELHHGLLNLVGTPELESGTRTLWVFCSNQLS